MFCSTCGSPNAGAGKFCSGCGATLLAPAGAAAMPAARAAAMPTSGSASQAALPPGVAGWSWGAFLLNWIWALGNQVWIGLLALIPYVGFIVAIWLGFKGREMAWKAKPWASVEEFNRVQQKWSKWAVGLVLAGMVIGMMVFVAIVLAARN